MTVLLFLLDCHIIARVTFHSFNINEPFQVIQYVCDGPGAQQKRKIHNKVSYAFADFVIAKRSLTTLKTNMALTSSMFPPNTVSANKFPSSQPGLVWSAPHLRIHTHRNFTCHLIRCTVERASICINLYVLEAACVHRTRW